MGNVAITDPYGSTGSGESGDLRRNFTDTPEFDFSRFEFPRFDTSIIDRSSFEDVFNFEIITADISIDDVRILDEYGRPVLGGYTQLIIGDMFESFGNLRTPTIGIFTTESNEAFRQLFQPPSTGVMIASILKNSGAEAAGLQARDIIVAFDGTPITNHSDLTAAMLDATTGQEVVLTVYRNGEQMDITVTLG
jgi:membrane-associated protease RseP (regulator of RpoE activity)